MTALRAFASNPTDNSLMLRLIEARQLTLGDRPFVSVDAMNSNSELLYGSLILLLMRSLGREVELEDDNITVRDMNLRNVIALMARALGTSTLIR